MTMIECDNCGKHDDDKPMAFKGQRWCSDECRKALGVTISGEATERTRRGAAQLIPHVSAFVGEGSE